jgi:hypothetical protein
MKSYKCQKCEFIFSDAEKVLSVAVPAGKCPKCSHSLPDYSSELYSHKIKHEPEVQKIEFGESANAFRCFNCSTVTFNKDTGHIPFIAVLGLNGILKFLLSLFGGTFNDKKTCQSCVSQATLAGVGLVFVRLLVIYLLITTSWELIPKGVFKMI